MEKAFQNKITKYYFLAIFLLFLGLVFSKFLISFSQILLLLIWIFEGNFKNKIEILKKDKPTLIFLSIFAILLIGFIWTEDIEFGLKELKIKAPLLVLPLIFSTSKIFTDKEFKIILFSFVIAILAKTIESSFFIIASKFAPSLEEISSISHIRYSLMIDLSIFINIYLIFFNNNLKRKYKILLWGLSAWLFIFLIFIQSLTGLIIFFILIVAIGLYGISKSNKILIKTLSLIFVISTIFLITFYIKNQYESFYTIKDPAYNALPKYTLSGNEYYHKKDSYRLENGYHVDYYICKNELKKEWNKRASIKYNEKDKSGFLIEFTLIRYLTSKGLTKDSVGVYSLTDEDIKNIENGIANYKFVNTLSISNRIYKVIWQFNKYKYTQNANNQSITQRYEYLLTSFRIIKKNLVLGVGTGDVKNAFKQQYIEDESKLKEKNRRRSHNQLITFIITFGVFLGSWCIMALFLPYFLNKKQKEFLPSIFMIISILSMLTDNTLETSVSIGFFAIFYSFLILMKVKKL